MSFVVHRVVKSAARYTDAGGREKCGYCRFFVPPRSCGKVIGPVSPMGWCKHFSRQMVSQSGGGSTPISGGPPGATLSLDFMQPGTLDPRITFTRASSATYTDQSGTIQTAATNAPRWDYASGTLLGLLIEEQRTNILLNNAALSTQSIAVTAQAYTLSFYGTGTVTKSGAATGALVGTGAGQRVSQTFTPTAGTLTLTVTGSVLNAQVEAGSFVTSVIPTTSVSVTRAVDSMSMSPAALFSGVTAGTFNVEAIMSAANNVNYCALFSANDGTTNNRMQMYQVGNTNNISCLTVAASVGSGAPVLGAMTPGTAFKAAMTHRSAGFTTAFNGVTGPTDATPSPNPAILTAFTLGNGLGLAPMTGYWRRFTYWNRALSDAEMQQVTT